MSLLKRRQSHPIPSVWNNTFFPKILECPKMDIHPFWIYWKHHRSEGVDRYDPKFSSLLGKGLFNKTTKLKNRGRECLPNFPGHGGNSPPVIFKLHKSCSHRAFLTIKMISPCRLLIECAQYRKQFNIWFL